MKKWRYVFAMGIISLLLIYGISMTYDTSSMQAQDTQLSYQDGEKWNILLPMMQASSYAELTPYAWLSALLEGQPTIWADKESKIYDSTQIPELTAPQVSIQEVAVCQQTYTISYETDTGTFVILELHPDGTLNQYVRENRPHAPVLFYNGRDKTVISYIETPIS